MIEASAFSIARAYVNEIEHLINVFIEETEHEDFYFINILQSVVPHHKWTEYREQIEYLKKEA